MPEASNFHPLVPSERIQQVPDQSFSHPLNPNSEIHGVPLGDLAGLQRLGLYLAWIPPHKESFIYHSHESEEEFIYILSGRGIAEIDGETFEVGAGDFMGFPTPSVAHHLRNPFDEKLIYLMGGERRKVEVADFPHLQKSLIRRGKTAQIVNWDNLRSMFEGET